MRKFEFRPWGWYITLDEGANYKVKKIHLNPNTKLSLQYHHYRDCLLYTSDAADE